MKTEKSTKVKLINYTRFGEDKYAQGTYQGVFAQNQFLTRNRRPSLRF